MQTGAATCWFRVCRAREDSSRHFLGSFKLKAHLFDVSLTAAAKERSVGARARAAAAERGHVPPEDQPTERADCVADGPGGDRRRRPSDDVRIDGQPWSEAAMRCKRMLDTHLIDLLLVQDLNGVVGLLNVG